MERVARLGVRFIALGELDYPRTLQAIETAPPLLAVSGSAEVLRRPTVAIVGSRNASAAGLTLTERPSTFLDREEAFAIGLSQAVLTTSPRVTIAAQPAVLQQA